MGNISRIVETLSKYHDDPVGFSYDVVGFEPTDQQKTLMNSVANNVRVSAKSGHGIGKTRAEAVLGWWFLTTRKKSIVPCTAPSSHQLYDILWKELMWVRDQMPLAISSAFDCSSERIWHKSAKEQWYLQARTARSDKPEALQGFHGKHLLFLVEEAGGVDSKIFETVEGALTEKDNHILLVGNPTRTTGYFYDSHNLHRDEWIHLTFSSLDSPLYDKRLARSLKKRYGAQSNVYQIRVLGNFPGTEPDQLMSIQDLELCMDRDTSVLTPIVWGLDVARYGDDESVLARRTGHRLLPLEGWYNMDTQQLASAVMRRYQDTPRDMRPGSIIIDTNGIGAGVFDRMYHKNYPVVEFIASRRPADVLRYKNLKAEVYDTAADMVKNHKLSLPSVDVNGDPENELYAQGANIRYEIDDSSGLYSIVGKQKMKNTYHVPSPDRWEAFVMTLLDPELVTGLEDDDEDDFFGQEQRTAYPYDEFEGLPF